ncbi:TonB-dependent receptor [Rhodocyclaceae bacterium]
MKIKKIAALIAIAGLSTSAFATNGYFAHGYGMKAKGMGGVGIAYGQDALAAANNPANMVMLGNRWDVGVEYFRPQRESAIVGNGAGANGKYDGNDSENYFVPEFGYNRMIGNNMSVGLSVYGNGGMATDYGKNPFAAFGTTGKAGVDLAQLFIAPTLSYKLNENHSVGVTLKVAYQTFEAFGLSNPPALVAGFAGISSNPAKLTNNDHDSSWGYGIGLGWTGQVTPTLKLGATYQSRTRMQEFDKYKGLFAEKGGFDIPENFGIGMAWQATPQLVIAADVQQINYSKVKSIANPLRFPPGAGQLLGNNGGSGFGWDDMTVYKLGAAYDLNKDWTLRVGYNHGSQPISKSQTFFNILAPGVVEDHLTLGATWRLQGGGEVTFMYMHAFDKEVKGSKSIPAGFGGGDANIKMYQDSFGISYGAKF